LPAAAWRDFFRSRTVGSGEPVRDVPSTLRVLTANIPLPRNRFLQDLNGAMSRHCDLIQSSDDFWAMRGGFDIVHLHWPEYISYEMQAAYTSSLRDELIDALEARLQFWSENARLVVTRHNTAPHDAPDDAAWQRVYSLVYSYAAGVVHMGNASVEDFATRYSTLSRNVSDPLAHSVIPHQNYASLPNQVSRADARRQLGIRDDARVMLVFGALRNDAESSLALETFRALNVKRKLLLASSWRLVSSWRFAERLYFGIHPGFKFNYGFVPDNDAQFYLNAADVLFVPRLRNLNSANVTLGMTFGAVVVGPDSGNTAEILRSRSNPLFDPDIPQTAVTAMEEGYRLAGEGSLGRSNREYALKELDVADCAASYLSFFRQVRA
jgi:glycosyltransferase involved in cell wall biosynthesis